MSYSRVQYTGTGGESVYQVPFAYLSKAYVEVRINGVLQVPGTDYSWPSSSAIALAATLTTDSVLDIRRNTPKTARLVDFQDAAVLTEADLDKNSDQMFQAVQEVIDDMDSTLVLDSTGVFDADGARITHVGDPEDAQDVATKAWVETAAASPAAAAKASATAAASSASAAASSAAAAANSATTALNAASSAAAAAAEAVTASVTTSANLATEAAEDAEAAAATTASAVASASASATAAAGSASAAATSASEAASSAAAAGASEDAASASATAAGTSATAAAASASAASTSASNASSFAINAGASADAASASAAAAAASAASVEGGTVLATGTDTTAKTLTEKIVVAGDLVKTVVNPGGDEQIQLSVTIPEQAVVPVTSVFGRVGDVVLTVEDIHALDGAGSEIDADTVDGKHASAFALASHTHSYAPTTAFVSASVTNPNSGTEYWRFTRANGSYLQVNVFL